MPEVKINNLEKLLKGEIGSRYRGLMSLSELPLVISAPDGEVLYEFTPTPDFCKYVCQKDGEVLCSHFRDMMKSDEPVYNYEACKNGLLGIVVPIRGADGIEAYVAGGFAYAEASEFRRYMLNIQEMAENKDMPVEVVARSIALLKTVSEAKENAHLQLCNYMAQSISRILINGKGSTEQSVEKDMLEKRILELESKEEPLLINTNFLFSTLNCIARTAYFEEAKQTEMLIYYLSDLLRFNSKSGFMLRNLQSELENIEKYFYIQQVRYKTRLQYEIDVPESLYSCRIPNMVLQPLVENAIVHGILQKRDGGMIRITAENHRSHVVIYVIDNGIGFDEEKLKTLRASGFTGDPDSSLCVTNERIKNYYGEQCGIDVVRSDHSGCTISITITNTSA
ncbi:MAG: histidine kinase [Clostridia bacterium]|nr:histidine kinase [Clostridia bacterium]